MLIKEIKNNKYKKDICNNWNEGKCKYDKKDCLFAHGKEDIIKSKCRNGNDCYNEDCLYEHPNEWNPYNNKKECMFCSKGFCNKKDIKYNHIIDNNYIKKDIIKEVDKNIELKLNNEDFPELIKSKDINEYKYSKILTFDLKNKLNIEDSIHEKNDELSFEQICDIPLPESTEYEDIIFEIESKRKYIGKLKEKSKDWSLSEEDYNEIMEEINNIKQEIKRLENINDNEQPNIDIKINGIDFKNIDLKNILTVNNTILNKKEDKIYNLIKDMKKSIKIYNKEIKQSIDNKIRNDYFKFILINNINNMQVMVDLFEDNYKDICKKIKTDK